MTEAKKVRLTRSVRRGFRTIYSAANAWQLDEGAFEQRGLTAKERDEFYRAMQWLRQQMQPGGLEDLT
jgi:hypothetical protein